MPAAPAEQTVLGLWPGAYNRGRSRVTELIPRLMQKNMESTPLYGLQKL